MKGMFLLIVLTVYFGGCKEENSVVSPSAYVIDGKYQYEGFNLDSNLCTYGVINIVLHDSTISGERDIKGTDIIDSRDIETGAGTISGFILNDSTFFIDLKNSNIPTVLLIGKFSNGMISGKRIFEYGGRPAPPVIGYYTLRKQIIKY